MRPVLIDASSAILLFKASIFEPVAAAYRLSAGGSVCRELTCDGYPGAETFRQAMEEGSLVCRPVATAAASLPSALHAGERDTLTLLLGGEGDFVIVDDREAALFCRRRGLPYINALLCPRILALAGRIAPEEVGEYMSRLLRVGRYGGEIIAFARTCDDERLLSFLP